ncbi:hypothetical protein K438DRAFT_1784824 [Mycena galopus ATCC 62051]|nr:hypothetical protein K438DRAFT_1784824 [Mycena galopus ATCC 62051]
MHAIPRERIQASRDTTHRPLHSGPPKKCPISLCNGADSSIVSISTEWPLLLRIDPICGSYNPAVDTAMAQVHCPLILNLGTDVQYHLIARVLYIPPEATRTIGHYMTKTRVKGRTYLYNDLERKGVLTDIGPLYLLEESDPQTSYVLYLRRSKASNTSHLVSEIQADLERIPPLPKVIIDIPDDVDPKIDGLDIDRVIDDEVDQMLIDSIESPTKKSTRAKSSSFPMPPDNSQDRFYTPDETSPPSPDFNAHQQSFAETDSQTPCPVHCHGCGMVNPDGDGDFEEVQCEQCRQWSHMSCLPSEINWTAEDIHFICKYCRDEDPLGEILWPGRIVMVPDPNIPDWRAPGVLWYPATFVKRHKKVAPNHEYEFQWFECTDGTVYQSKDSALPSSIIRRFTRERGFCEEIEYIDLTANMLGKIRLPFYMHPDHPRHKNPELADIFSAAIPQIAEILAAFDSNHRVVANFLNYFRSRKEVERRKNAGNWMASLGLVPTPELEVVLDAAMAALLRHENFLSILEEECEMRVMGVGSALLQILAVQYEIGEPLDLNGDILMDFFADRVVPCPTDGPKALEAMFAATPFPEVNTGSNDLLKQMLIFNKAHAFYDPHFRPPTFRRAGESIVTPTTPMPVLLKRKADVEIEGEKSTKRPKKGKKTKPVGSPAKEKVWGHRLRSRALVNAVIGGDGVDLVILDMTMNTAMAVLAQILREIQYTYSEEA